MKYKVKYEPIEFNKEFAHDGDMYLYQENKLIYIGNTIPSPLKPSLLNRIRCLFSKTKKEQRNEDKH